MVIAAEDFYHALCSESASTHCLYGLVNALFVLAAGLHLSARQEGLGEGAQMAQAPMVLLSARAPSANGGGRRLAQVGQAVSRRWCQGHLHRQFGCGGSVVDACLYEACASWKSGPAIWPSR